jgi:hypothetical protein
MALKVSELFLLSLTNDENLQLLLPQSFLPLMLIPSAGATVSTYLFIAYRSVIFWHPPVTFCTAMCIALPKPLSTSH